jgi:hypothetical protein
VKLLWQLLITVCAIAWLMVTLVPQWLYVQSLATTAELLSASAWLLMRGSKAIVAHLERLYR